MRAMTGLERVFEPWREADRKVWGHQPMRLKHNLGASPLFSRDVLAELIDAYPRENYTLVAVGEQGDDMRWDEGDIGNMPGADVLDAIEAGLYWLNLRSTETVDPRYQGLLAQIFSEIDDEREANEPAQLPSLGILISSSKSQTYYHCDLPNQFLWQVVGEKTVWVYPTGEPFMSGEDLERIAIFEKEVDMHFEPWFDEHAVRFELKPGEMLYWPLNAPHRVENRGGLSISMTMEYWTAHALRQHRLNLANGTLRHWFGWTPRSRATSGIGFFAKSALSSAMARTGWMENVRSVAKPVTFSLDQKASRDDLTPAGSETSPTPSHTTPNASAAE